MEHNETVNDTSIRAAVQSVTTPLPPHLDRRVSLALRRSATQRAPRVSTRRRRMGIALAGTLAVAALLWILPGDHPRADVSGVDSPSIKTQFDIPGKKIKIIWMQREGFSLPSGKGVSP